RRKNPTMANIYPSSTPQPPDSSVGAGVPNFYISPVPTVQVDPSNQNLSRDDLDSDTLQGFETAAENIFRPGVYEVTYSPVDLGGVDVTINRTGDQQTESG